MSIFVSGKEIIINFENIAMETNTQFENFILFLGPYKWPLGLLALVILGMTLYKSHQYFILRKPDERGLQAILFWGIVAAALGLIAQVHGIWLSLNAIISAPDISPPVVLVGFLSTFSPTLFGLVIGFFAVLSWWGLKWQKTQLDNRFIHEPDKL